MAALTPQRPLRGPSDMLQSSQSQRQVPSLCSPHWSRDSTSGLLRMKDTWIAERPWAPSFCHTVLAIVYASGHWCETNDAWRSRWCLSFLLFIIMLAVGLPYMAFAMLRYVPFMPTFWKVQQMIVEFCQKPFLGLWKNHMAFSLQFVNVLYHTNWFVDIEKSLHLRDKSHLIVVFDPFNLLDSNC